jgi:hypothetical protein
MLASKSEGCCFDFDFDFDFEPEDVSVGRRKGESF